MVAAAQGTLSALTDRQSSSRRAASQQTNTGKVLNEHLF